MLGGHLPEPETFCVFQVGGGVLNCGMAMRDRVAMGDYMLSRWLLKVCIFGGVVGG